MIVSAINKIGEQFPDIIKHLPASSLDNIADALKDGKQISKAEYSKLKKIYEAAGKNLDKIIDDMLGDLDWGAIVSKKGETRLAHVNRHAVPQPTRTNHGVFNDNAEHLVDTAWNNRTGINAIDDGMGGSIYNIPYANAGYESGTTNTGEILDYITIVTKRGTNQLIAAFPTNGKYPN